MLETTRLGIEVKNLKMRVESLSSRLDFSERRARALEGVVQYRAGDAPEAEAAPPAASDAGPRDGQRDGEAAGPADARRKRRRRRGRRSGARGPGDAPAASGTEGGAGGGTEAGEEGDGGRPGPARREGRRRGRGRGRPGRRPRATSRARACSLGGTTTRTPAAKAVRLGVVVQRYGADINGGAELHARYIAEHLARHAEVEVLTTCARDYVTWRNELPPGVESVNGVPVRRFPVRHPRDPRRFGRRSARVFHETHSIADELAWLEGEGPASPALVAHLRRAGRGTTTSCSSASGTTTPTTGPARCPAAPCSSRRLSAIRPPASASSARCFAASGR